MIDAHLHLNLGKEDPIGDLLNIYEANSLCAAVLILNSAKEAEILLAGIDRLSNIRLHIALIFDINDTASYEDLSDKLREAGFDVSVKLHPRLTGIRISDFDRIIEALGRYDFKNIIVDNFYFGADMDVLIAKELCICLAKAFPDKKVIMAHYGGIKVLECMMNTRCLSNVYYDISLSVSYLEGTSVWKDILHCAKFTRQRVMFGSDYPDFDIPKALDSFVRLFAEEDMLMREDILKKNALNIYFED